MRMLLRPGDVMMYWSHGFFSWAIATKTWHKVSHVETYIGDGLSIASRDGIGVGTYPVRLEGLIQVMRPTWDFDLAAVMRWQKTVEGQPYDWRTLLNFIGVVDNDDPGMICSEHAAEAAIVSGGTPFGEEPSKLIAPFQFGTTPLYTCRWKKV